MLYYNIKLNFPDLGSPDLIHLAASDANEGEQVTPFENENHPQMSDPPLIQSFLRIGPKVVSPSLFDVHSRYQYTTAVIKAPHRND